MQIFLYAVYFGCLCVFFIYSLFQLHLAILYLRGRRNGSEPAPPAPDPLPVVTVQLPVFNEIYVCERLIESVAGLDYPKDRLEIQVLDDSTDGTSDALRLKVAALSAKGLDISLIHRDNREGFKGGALNAGTRVAKGEFLAIFDADFVPEPDFLLTTVPWFNDESIGAVQTRWAYLNKHFSFLTRVQALALDAHFTIEKNGRGFRSFFSNFNGTGGIWRKSAILDAGGWNGGILTEDLDLSYRAQLKGWKIRYLEEVLSPSELPVDICAIRSQQFRWIKGGVQTSLILSKPVVNAPSVPWVKKIHGLFHLFSGYSFIALFLMSIVSVPLFLSFTGKPMDALFLNLSSIFLIPTLILLFYYGIPYFRFNKGLRSVPSFIVQYFTLVALLMGLSFSNAIAVTEALLGIRSSFIRTPKTGTGVAGANPSGNVYRTRRLSPVNLLEGLLALGFLAAVIFAFYSRNFTFLYLHLLLLAGFGTIFILTVKRAFGEKAPVRLQHKGTAAV